MAAKKHSPKEAKKKSTFGGFFSFLSKKDKKKVKEASAKSKKLSKNFADNVLDLELKLDSGNFDIHTVNSLMQLYSQAVEYYSGMNDVRYIHFTERIQNMLVKPDILALMNS